MSHELEALKLTQRYLKEVDKQDLTIEQIQQRPRWRQVQYWWKARAHYEGMPMSIMSIEDMMNIYGE